MTYEYTKVSLPDLQVVANRLAAQDEYCIDYETSGLDHKRNHIVGYVLTFGPRPDDTYYLPFRHAGGGNYEGPQTIPQDPEGWDGTLHPFEHEIKAYIGSPNTRKFGHNLAFDLKFGHRMGIPVEGQFEDTIINAALINELQYSFSLEVCCRIAGVALKKTTIYDYISAVVPEAAALKKGQMAFFYKLAGDDKEAYEYAAGDGTSTWQLRDKQMVEIRRVDTFQGKAVPTLEKVWNIESRLLPVLVRMMLKGIKIDERQLEAMQDVINDRRGKLKAKLPEGFNPLSPNQVKALMTDLGHTDWPLTEKGNASFPEKWMITNPTGAEIVRVRKYNNLEASFINPLRDRHMFKGRVHCEFNQLKADEYGTVTGRLSSSNPNLQQVPKRNKEIGPLFRSAFVPDDGMVWESGDYSQCEPRLLAYYARVKVLMAGYMQEPFVDAHSSVAKAANIDREDGKRLNQALVTGSGDRAAAEQMGKTLKEAQPILDAYFGAMPEIKPFQKFAARTMIDRGYMVSLIGRRARLDDPRYAYRALNRLLQCGNADVLKVKLVEVDDFLRDPVNKNVRVDLLNNVHDAFEAQREDTPEGEKVFKEVIRIMQDFGPNATIKLDIPMVVDHHHGPNWSIATYKDSGVGRLY